MRITTCAAAIEAVADYATSAALPISTPAALRSQVRDVWVRALAADDSFDPAFTLVTQVAARGSRIWAVHRRTGLVFSSVPVPGDLSWLEEARATVEMALR